MILPLITSFSNEYFLFNENIINFKNIFTFTFDNVVLNINLFINFESMTFLNEHLLSTNFLKNFLLDVENTSNFKNFENINAIYHYSIPNVKLFYPEPFIAAPSFMHSDLWFMHILIYQYWLWFVFIFIIVFFFITFISTIRWCNMRIRPRKETRGVSRSKCGDLITACVPVTWATSIIVSESTDAMDFYDGFGTTELVIGIRAYQWGWEYYYPKDIDVNYTIRNNFSLNIGNSLKYNKTVDSVPTSNNFWKFYQNKTHDQILPTAHLITIPFEDYKMLNILSFTESGLNLATELNSFRKTKIFSKFNKIDFYHNPRDLFLTFNQLNSLYFNDSEFLESNSIGTKNQTSHSSLKMNLNQQTKFLNKSVLNKFFNFNNKTFLNLFLNKKFLIFNDFIKHFKITNIKTYRDDIKFFELTPQTLNLSTKQLSGANSFSYLTRSDKAAILKNYKNPVITATPTKFLPPLISTNSTINSNLFNLFNTLIPAQSKKNFNLNNEWNYIWSQTQFLWKINSNDQFFKTLNNFYLSSIVLYYDYDFRNWQFFQFVEDSLWESTLSAYAATEYSEFSTYFDNEAFPAKGEELFVKIDQNWRNKILLFKSPLTNQNWIKTYFYSNPLLLDDTSSQFSLLNLKDFNEYSNFYLNSFIEETYEDLKTVCLMLNFFGKNINLNNSVANLALHQLFVFDAFRTDFDSFSWFSDENNLQKVIENSFFFEQSEFKNVLMNNKLLNLTSPNFFKISQFLTENNKIRETNLINTRSGAKGSVLNFNAMQKVFRPRFDEGRSFAKIDDFGYSESKQQFVSANRVNYEKIIGKTHDNFFKINFFKNNFKTNFNIFSETHAIFNYYTFDFPFLLGLKSDASKYFWFDWFARWGFYEVQPASSSKYAIFGMPYFNKAFEFQGANIQELNESENYLTRISRARRNYITNWTNSPYLSNKNNSWYVEDYFYILINETNNPLIATIDLLKNIKNTFTAISANILKKNYDSHFLPSHSGTFTYNKTDWKPKHSIQSFYYASTQLVDIFSKREYIIRELFASAGNVFSLPHIFTASASNPLLSEIKLSFSFVDPVSLNNEYSRSSFLQSSQFFNFLVLKSFTQDISTSLVKLNFFYDLFAFSQKNTSSNIFNVELQKNQYRPMRKSISNMIRLHASGAIAMPTEMRIQILASSKDVIHSWAVPSAGIKIDCVPGYSSHKVMFFLVSGIFWGQCMEICGRYHHWMPIIVYFMKRDLFFLWCSHFAFINNQNTSLVINDKQHVDYVKHISFNKYAWLNEIC